MSEPDADLLKERVLVNFLHMEKEIFYLSIKGKLLLLHLFYNIKPIGR